MSKEGYFIMESEVKLDKEMFEIEYTVHPYRQPVIGIPAYGYTVELTYVYNVPAECLTEDFRLRIVNAITDDIQTEIDERYPDGDFYKEEEE